MITHLQYAGLSQEFVKPFSLFYETNIVANNPNRINRKMYNWNLDFTHNMSLCAINDQGVFTLIQIKHFKSIKTIFLLYTWWVQRRITLVLLSKNARH